MRINHNCRIKLVSLLTYIYDARSHIHQILDLCSLQKIEILNKLTCQSLYYPTNAHNVKNVELLKHIKIMEAAPTCFGLQRNHHQGATASA